MFKKILSFAMAAIMVMGIGTTALANTSENESSEVTSNVYNIVNTPEWSSLSREERMNACQLSVEQLQNLSTDELIQVILDYPFFIDAMAFNTTRDGFLRVFSESTALQELIGREDAANALIDRYSSTTVINNESTRAINNDFSDIWKLEIILPQPEIANKMTEQQLNKTLEIAEEKFNEKSVIPEIYSGVTGIFFKGIQENSGTETYAYDSYVTTPNGSSVYVQVWQSADGDYSSQTKADYKRDVAAAYPNVTWLRDATTKYNCHSYAWYSTSSTNKYWMPYPSYFITDGSYAELTKLGTNNGDRIVYFDTNDDTYSTATHSARIYSYKDYPKSKRTFVVESKWGSLGLYRHDSMDSPYSYINKFPCDIKYFE